MELSDPRTSVRSMTAAAVDEQRHLDEVRELERGLGPFDDPEWRDDLALLSSAGRFASISLANDAETLVGLAARVPRSRGDERGGTPWTSFLREVAVAKKISDRAAPAEVALAHALVARHPRTLARLRRAQVPAHRARVLVEECAQHTDQVAAAAEERLAHRLGSLSPSRIRQDVAALALRLDADAAARKEAEATANRSARRSTLADAQAEVVLTGPAVAVQQWWDALTDRARALKAAGDPRNLSALRFDLATQSSPETAPASGDAVSSALGIHPTSGAAPPLLADARCTRPVQATITVPAATALGLSDEPGWLDGYGWISAPLSRQLLTVAELRKACVSPTTGQLVDVSDRVTRPRLSAQGLRDAVRGMVLEPHVLRPVVTDAQPQHDPSPFLTAFVTQRDRYCDGPTGTAVPSRRAEKDHERPWPLGPTAAWNLTSRSTRTHQLKHAGWSPVRDAAGTTWTSPAGQVVAVPRHDRPPELPPPGRALPDPDDLAERDAALTRARLWPDDDLELAQSGQGQDASAAPGAEVAAARDVEMAGADPDALHAGARRHGWSDEPAF
jgi:mRNA-degrading endonuclease toxin of MazEF toxin-antitoxin module